VVPAMAAEKEYCTPSGIKAVQFFPDNDRIAMHHCYFLDDPSNQHCLWFIFQLSTKKLYEFTILNKATPHKLKFDVAFSRDGKQIAFVSGQDNHRNIYVMNIDGTDLRQLTHDNNENPPDVIHNPSATNLSAMNIAALKGKGYWGRDNLMGVKYNEKPSFSPDGKRIIFVRSAARHRYRVGSGDPMQPLLWDVYEIEIETIKERRLTDFAFYAIASPYYLSDGKRFVFSADVRARESGINDEYINDYEKKYKYNTIFILDGVNNELRPAFVSGGFQSSDPKVSYDNIIIFKSRINEVGGKVWTGEGQSIAGSYWHFSPFIYRDGCIKRLLTDAIDLYTISQNGSKALLKMHNKLLLINADGTGLTEIEFPWKPVKNPGSSKETKDK
jgi:dipeptidyl aminopeptidase/acylaminoacyl peptidase